MTDMRRASASMPRLFLVNDSSYVLLSKKSVCNTLLRRRHNMTSLRSHYHPAWCYSLLPPNDSLVFFLKQVSAISTYQIGGGNSTEYTPAPLLNPFFFAISKRKLVILSIDGEVYIIYSSPSVILGTLITN